MNYQKYIDERIETLKYLIAEEHNEELKNEMIPAYETLIIYREKSLEELKKSLKEFEKKIDDYLENENSIYTWKDYNYLLIAKDTLQKMINNKGVE